jgi:23S rRNA (guanosine2251-2'-O)-methyltransferase
VGVNDLIIGSHSIAAALLNPKRVHIELLATDDGWQELVKRSKLDTRNLRIKPRLLAPHALQEEARMLYRERDLEFQRVPGSVVLISEPLEVFDPGWLRTKIESTPKLRILALDQVSDVNNGAAILRTASFFGVDVVVLPQEKSFGMSPAFYRIASGATEFLTIVRSAHLTRTLTMMKEVGVEVWGLSEHSASPLTNEDLAQPKICLVLGSEDDGLSNSVMRTVSKTLSLTSQGAIKSLNVSAAATLALQLCFPQRSS